MSCPAARHVAFLSTGSGGLEIADTSANRSAFTGAVSGFGGVNHTNHKQFIDLVSVTSNAADQPPPMRPPAAAER